MVIPILAHRASTTGSGHWCVTYPACGLWANTCSHWGKIEERGRYRI